MAIDDNTTYGLTGAQVKELPERIEAVKGTPRVLTTDDYNYPVNNPTRIALWLLEPGMYRWDPSLGSSIYYTTTTYVTEGNNAIIGRYITNPNTNAYNVGILVFPITTQTFIRYQVTNSNGGTVANSTLAPLSISGSGAPTTSTAGVNGQVYLDNTTHDAYLLTGYYNGGYQWKAL